MASSSAARSPTSPTQVEALPYAERFNPNVLAVAQDADGKVYGVPFAAYGIGLHYNRQLFEEAGLDPDAPPTTWAEVRDGGQDDRRRDRPGRLRPAVAGQHRRLDAHRADGRQRRAHAGGHRRGHRRRPSTTRAPSQALELLHADAVGGQLDGEQLPVRVGHDQPGVRGRPDRHVHDRLGRLQQPRHRERRRSRLVRPDDPAARRCRRRRAQRRLGGGDPRRRHRGREGGRRQVDRLLLHGEADRRGAGGGRRRGAGGDRRPDRDAGAADLRRRAAGASPTPGWPTS